MLLTDEGCCGVGGASQDYPRHLEPQSLGCGAFGGSRTYLDAGIPSIMASDHGTSSERSFAGCNQDGQVGAINGVRKWGRKRGPHLGGVGSGDIWQPFVCSDVLFLIGS